MKIWIKNIDVIPVDGKNDLIKDTNIYIVDGKIAHIGDVNLDIEVDREIDGLGKVLMPGLVNAHTHIGMSLLRNYADDLPLFEWLSEKIWPIEGKMTDEDIYWGSLLSMVEMIQTGTTTFCDMYDSMDFVAKRGRKIWYEGYFDQGSHRG